MESKPELKVSPEDSALIGLSTLGPNCYYKPPNMIVGRDGVSTAARSFDRDLLERLVMGRFAQFHPEWSGYTLTQEGAARVLDVLLGNVSGAIGMLSGMVRFGFSVGIHWTGERFKVVVMSRTPYIAEDEDLGKAIGQVKVLVDRSQFGS